MAGCVEDSQWETRRSKDRRRSRSDNNSQSNYSDNGWVELEVERPRNNYNNSKKSWGPNKRINDKNPLIMYVNQDKVGRVIGRGGQMINSLNSNSGAKISVDRYSNNGQTAVKIFGTDDAKDSAKRMIEDVIQDRPSHSKRETQNERAPSPELIVVTPYTSPPPPPPSDAESAAAPAEPASTDPCTWDSDNSGAKWIEKRMASLPVLRKNFYEELPEVRDLSDLEVEKIRASKNNIETYRVFESEEEFKVPNPVTTFEQAFHNYPEILKEIKKAGFQNPSPIQCQAWPILLSGKDMIGIAQTGTGKTLAFLLPALIHIDGQKTPRNKRPGPDVMIMAPTRELAQQINEEAAKYRYRGIKSVCLYGGGSRQDQIAQVEKGVQMVIATPGRLNDLHRSGALDVSHVSYVVLDEADRMLDLGFEGQIRRVLIEVRPDRQIVMTSATWPAAIRRLASTYSADPIQVVVGTLDLTAATTVEQHIEIVEEDDKLELLKAFVQNMQKDEKAIVFIGQRTKVDHVASDLALLYIPVRSIHGKIDQEDREEAVREIRSGEVKILLATDVASRGLDIDDVTHVINYDFPKEMEEYVHRVGRTGRAGKKGQSISWLTRRDWHMAEPLIKIMKDANQKIPKELEDMARRYKNRPKRPPTQGRRNGGGNNGYGDFSDFDDFGGGRRKRW